MKIYQAGPLFSEAERLWHKNFQAYLEDKGFTALWPGDLITSHDVASWGKDAPKKILEADKALLLDCDAVVALLDGTQVDDGTAWEIGFAHAMNKPVFGIRTDFRNGGECPGASVNAMIEGCVECIAKSKDELVQELRKYQLKKNSPL